MRGGGKSYFPTIRRRHLLDDLSFRGDFNLLAYVKARTSLPRLFPLTQTFIHVQTHRRAEVLEALTERLCKHS